MASPLFSTANTAKPVNPTRWRRKRQISDGRLVCSITTGIALIVQIVEREDGRAPLVYNILIHERDQLSILFARVETVSASQIRDLGYLIPARAAGRIYLVSCVSLGLSCLDCLIKL